MTPPLTRPSATLTFCEKISAGASGYANFCGVLNFASLGHALENRVEPETRNMARAVGQIGEKWALLILWEAMRGTTRFDEFQRKLGVARNILSRRLNKLVADGVLAKVPMVAGGRRMEYRLTAKGEGLRSALHALGGWGFHHEAAADETRH